MIYSKSMIDTFRSALVQVESRRENDRIERYHNARQKALYYARYLGEFFGASKVVLVGSLLNIDCFTERSDIDLVVYDLPKECFFKSVADCMNDEFYIDIIPIENANTFLKEQITKNSETLYEQANR